MQGNSLYFLGRTTRSSEHYDFTSFIDFEYFGWDDPAKFVSDFILHPSMNLNFRQKMYFVKNCYEFFSLDKSFNDRLRVSYFLYSICWCLILLNDFLLKNILSTTVLRDMWLKCFTWPYYLNLPRNLTFRENMAAFSFLFSMFTFINEWNVNIIA